MARSRDRYAAEAYGFITKDGQPWLSFGLIGAAHMWANLTQPSDGLLFSPVNGVIAFCYAVTAFAAAVGLWLMRRWGLQAFLSWLGVLAVMSLVMFVGPFGWMNVSIFVLFVALVALSITRYARRKILQDT